MPVSIPRPEHPKPQFERKHWMNLNGEWQFEIDNARTGAERGLLDPAVSLSGRILVPFCPESELSGVGHRDFLLGVWYKRAVTLTAAQCAGRVVLHFGAVDYECDAYVNGAHAGYHKGGYSSFRFDVTELVREGENSVAVFARDDTRDPMVPRGKQCEKYRSQGCNYTRTTGIWQTVWLEFTPSTYIEGVRCDTDLETATLTLTAALCGAAEFTARVSYEGRAMGEARVKSGGGQVACAIALREKHLWEPGAGRLYDLELRYGEDEVKSYFGLRSIRLDDTRFLINERSVFQRLVLDQGFYPDGVITAPGEEDLIRDIDLAMAMGFNGARLHQKLFEERFLYHCDRKGYLVWGEYPNWGLDHSRPEAIYGILPEWLEALERDRNHPSIIGWIPFNETWDKKGRKQFDELICLVYRATKAVDPSRPCIDASGNFHVETDIFDVHDYEQDPAVFKEHYDRLMRDGTLYNWFVARDNNTGGRYPLRQDYTGGPTFVSEYGGIRWGGDEGGWGYGDGPANEEAFKERFRGLADALLDNHRMFGLCYTQLTDVEQEQNGLYTDERAPKFDPAWFRAVLSRRAAIEDESPK